MSLCWSYSHWSRSFGWRKQLWEALCCCVLPGVFQVCCQESAGLESHRERSGWQWHCANWGGVEKALKCGGSRSVSHHSFAIHKFKPFLLWKESCAVIPSSVHVWQLAWVTPLLHLHCPAQRCSCELCQEAQGRLYCSFNEGANQPAALCLGFAARICVLAQLNATHFPYACSFSPHLAVTPTNQISNKWAVPLPKAKFLSDCLLKSNRYKKSFHLVKEQKDSSCPCC